jgi:phenylpropionate dioxygenase-like ring-hydroxylating dioxygenase large terminal subunit
MGKLMRQYWVPACLSSELKPGGAPLRVMLLCEKLIAFRTQDGRVGLMEHACPHRCASLFFGRNEPDGIRCAYHGWKYDLDGNCLEMPNVPAHQNFSSSVKARAYKTRERNGIVYAYMGEAEQIPELPQIEALLLPESQALVRAHQRECNWLQSLEGDIDTSHFGFLHMGSVDADQLDDSVHRYAVKDRAPEYYLAETDWGAMYTAYRAADPGEIYYRVAHFLFPFWTLTPNGDFDDNIAVQGWVPMDDTHTMVFSVFYKQRKPALRTLKGGAPVPGLEPEFNREPMPMLPDTGDWFGRLRTARNMSNDYMIDREAQANRSFSGIASVPAQDQAMVESMGPITDRSKENLSASDRMIAVTRKRLLRAAMALEKEGIAPPALHNPNACHGARGGAFSASDKLSWLEAYANEVKRASNPTGVLHAAE